MISPDAKAHLDTLSKPKIMDLATGNGIWATDLSELYPNADIIGLDLSDEQFPVHGQLPENVHLNTYDLFTPAPEMHRGKYDLVHLRLTVGWIHGRDGNVVLQNALSFLKPGGYLQWEENTGPNAERPNDAAWVVKPDGTYTRGWPSWLTALSSPSLLAAFSWLQGLPELFGQNGLEEVQVYRPEPRKALLRTHTDCLKWTLEEIHGAMIRGGVPGSQEMRRSAIAAMDEDVRKGYSFVYGWTIVVGRKPPS